MPLDASAGFKGFQSPASAGFLRIAVTSVARDTERIDALLRWAAFSMTLLDSYFR